jgi:hypothetical protein
MLSDRTGWISKAKGPSKDYVSHSRKRYPRSFLDGLVAADDSDIHLLLALLPYFSRYIYIAFTKSFMCLCQIHARSVSLTLLLIFPNGVRIKVDEVMLMTGKGAEAKHDVGPSHWLTGAAH